MGAAEQEVKKKTKRGKRTTTSSKRQKVRAEDDVIAYAETHQEEQNDKQKTSPPPPMDESPKDDPLVLEGIDGLTGKKVKFRLSEVEFLHRTVYVENIHANTPNILAVQYRAGGSRMYYVVVRITEEQFNWILSQKPNVKVSYSYVDDFLQNDPNKNVFYDRTYVFDKPDWPTREEILEQDKQRMSRFGPPVYGEIGKYFMPYFPQKKMWGSSKDPDEQSESTEGEKQNS